MVVPWLKRLSLKRFRINGKCECSLSDSCCADLARNIRTKPFGNFIIFEQGEITNMQTEVVEKIYTASEYLTLEERAKNKHEFYNGNIVKMPGGTHIHNEIAGNLLGILKNALYKKNFKVYTSDMKIHIPRLQSFVYPDAVVVCEKAQLYEGRADIIINPLLIVEVASVSTRKYDRSSKFQQYKTLPSFKEYLLVEQKEPWVISSYKIADYTWKDTEATSLHSSLYLPSIDCTIELEKVYEGIEF